MGNRYVKSNLICPIELEMIETFPNGYFVIASNEKIISLYDYRSAKFAIGKIQWNNIVEGNQYRYARSVWWLQFIG